MTQYLLTPDQAGFCFTNQAKEKSVTFYSKQDGIDILKELLEAQKISAENALSLLEEIVALTFFPITERKLGMDNLIDQDLFALVKIKALQHFFSMIQNLEKLSEPKIILCVSCKEHASIAGPRFFCGHFSSKEEGRLMVEELKDRGLINLAEEIKLQRELEETNLPEKEKLNPAFNN